jgi:hypothetical protein
MLGYGDQPEIDWKMPMSSGHNCDTAASRLGRLWKGARTLFGIRILQSYGSRYARKILYAGLDGHHEQQERRTGNNVLEKDRGAAILTR